MLPEDRMKLEMYLRNKKEWVESQRNNGKRNLNSVLVPMSVNKFELFLNYIRELQKEAKNTKNMTEVFHFKL